MNIHTNANTSKLEKLPTNIHEIKIDIENLFTSIKRRIISF